MAVSSSPVSASKKMETQKPQKRSKDPGVRVIGGRIYDSQNGKTCHQCRQKTMDITARCKNMKNAKQCTIMFCHKCLLNRYGENAEEMATTDDWHCPKCRDICNCSFCMKKKGHKPTGILVHTAKATGFSSVSQMLDVKGPNVSKEPVAKTKVSSPKKPTDSTKDNMVSSPTKRGKENSIDGTSKMNSNSQNLGPNVKKAKKAKKDSLKGKDEVPAVNEIVSTPKKHSVVIALRRSPRKFILPHESKQEKSDDEKTCALKSPIKSHVPQVNTKKEDKMDLENGAGVCVAKKEKKTKVQAEGKTKKNKANADASIFDKALDVALPPGALLTNVAGIDLVPQDAGYALQFLEFCSSFGEVLKIRKGQPECVLRDILCERRRRLKNSSSSVQFILQLLSFMEEDSEEESEESEESPASPSNGKSSCIPSLSRYLANAALAPEDIPEDWFDKGSDRYELLDSSQKLRLLTFLCDETLSTVQMRNWIEEQNLKFVEEGKEAKESLNAAKEKEKLVKRKLQEDIAKALMAKNGAPLTVAEHESIVSEIKAETKRVQEEISDAMGLVSKKRLRSDAARTEPIILDDNGRVYWRLKGLGDSSLLFQDMGGIQEVSPNDKWFRFDDEEMKIVEKYISAVRLKRHRANKLAEEATKKRSGSGPEGDLSSNDVSAIVTNNS
ncbi:uncharacterized protein LOC141643143 [Silene latifolia]|uniref:uncharacterized protein LOC141643143 n=1 Tax=Silene latifolia TaxID=37657 RepID=UPI003D784AB6